MIHVTAFVLALMLSNNLAEYPEYCGKNSFGIPPILNKKNYKLVQVQMLIRHGARTPMNKLWNDENVWNCDTAYDYMFPGLASDNNQSPKKAFKLVYTANVNSLKGSCLLGQLLPEGYKQELNNGKLFRSAYFGNGPNFLFNLNEEVNLANNNDIYLESSNVPRTITSGQAVITSMFKTNETPYTTIKWHTNELTTSYYSPNIFLCPRLVELEGKYKETNAYKNWLTNSNLLHLNKELQNSIRMNYSEAVFDYFLASICADKKLPDKVTKDLINKVIERGNEFSTFWLANPQENEYAKLVVSPLVNIIHQRMLARIKDKHRPSKSSAVRFALYSGHDTTLMPFLAALGSNIAKYQFVPFASYISIELYEVETNYFVRLVYNGKVVHLKDCPDGICPYEKFKEIIQFSSKYDCQSHKGHHLKLTKQNSF